jgi:hypothetical protein
VCPSGTAEELPQCRDEEAALASAAVALIPAGILVPLQKAISRQRNIPLLVMHSARHFTDMESFRI